ncbi:MAG: hypothetical protein PVF65_01250 [Sphingomonadales bacterium]|jgi:hypothetical protein
MAFRLDNVLIDERSGFVEKHALRFKLCPEHIAVLSAFAKRYGNRLGADEIEEIWRKADGDGLLGAGEIIADLEVVLAPILKMHPCFKALGGDSYRLRPKVQIVGDALEVEGNAITGRIISWAILLVLALLEAYFAFLKPEALSPPVPAHEIAFVMPEIYSDMEGKDLQFLAEALDKKIRSTWSGPALEVVGDMRRFELHGRILYAELTSELSLSLRLVDMPRGHLMWAGLYPLNAFSQEALLDQVLLDLEAAFSSYGALSCTSLGCKISRP